MSTENPVNHDDHIAKTKYKRGSVEQLLSYINREEFDLHDRAGHEMDGKDVQRLINRSKKHQFERHYIFSPKDTSMTNQQLAEATRDTVTKYFDGPTVDFGYAIHRDENGPHTHVALVGSQDDLEVYREGIDEISELSEEIFDEKAQNLEQELLAENDLDRDREQAEQPEQTRTQNAREQEREYRRTREAEEEEEEEEEEENENGLGI